MHLPPTSVSRPRRVLLFSPMISGSLPTTPLLPLLPYYLLLPRLYLSHLKLLLPSSSSVYISPSPLFHTNTTAFLA